MINKHNAKCEKLTVNNIFLLIITVMLFAFSVTQVNAMIAAQWQIIDFIDHGTRRIVTIDDNRWFFYRPEPNSELTLDISEGKIMIKTAVRQDIDEITYQVRIGNAFRNFTTKRVKTVDEFTVMEDIYLTLGPGTHRVSISTSNRFAYFKVFQEEEVWAVPTVREAFTPDRFERAYTLKSDDTESLYFSASNSAPLEFISIGPNEVTGFARFLVNNADEEGIFDIEVNNRTIETVTVPPRRTGSYWLAENPEQNLSIGRRIEFELPAGEHRVRIIPRSQYQFIFRFIMDIPEEIPVKDDPVFGLNAFQEVPVIREVLSGFELSVGTTLSYSNNVFSLSDHDLDRFDRGDSRFEFIETKDDLIINPSIKARYPINIGDYTIEPYLSANFSQYLNNDKKSNYSILTGLFNTYGNLNLNLYYGYYADNYVRDYFIRDDGDNFELDSDGNVMDESFIYDRNFYRIYPYFSLTRYDTMLLDFRMEEYFHEHYRGDSFTGYDGTATTVGIGWRRSFPTFFLRAFYYYRVMEGENITAFMDPSYESNIYDFQFRNKRVDLFGDYEFRPYIGFRFEDRFFTRDYVSGHIGRFDYQSSRNDRRYSFNFGSEFYIMDNLDIILDYNYFLRDSTSENRFVDQDKDYAEQTINLSFEYTFKF